MKEFNKHKSIILIAARLITWSYILIHLLSTAIIIRFNKQDKTISKDIFINKYTPYDSLSYDSLCRYLFINANNPDIIKKISFALPFDSDISEDKKALIIDAAYNSEKVKTNRIWYFSDISKSLMYLLSSLFLVLFWLLFDRIQAYTCSLIMSLQITDIFVICNNFRYIYEEYYIALGIGIVLFFISLKIYVKNKRNMEKDNK